MTITPSGLPSTGRRKPGCRSGWAAPISMTRTLTAALVLMGAAFGQVTTQTPIEPPHDSGQGITPAYEGWYRNPDGSANILIGYYNRNLKEALDIPVGPNNRVEPGGPDRGQPTHFVPGRQWGVFTITVPKDFAPDQKII